MAEPLIASFVVRIFAGPSAAANQDQAPWRVTVRHVQSDEEHQFPSLAEASAWMHQFAKEGPVRAEGVTR